MQPLLKELIDQYREWFGTQPAMAARAPGRVEILGNHTDYNGGGVLTVAIDRSVVIVGRPLKSNEVRLASQTLNDRTDFRLDAIEKDPQHPWADYAKGVLAELQHCGVEIGGFEALIGGDLPIGSGVSSSAALELATAHFMKALFPYEMDEMALAQLGRRAENEFVGMPCGLLDQFSAQFGQADSFLFLDCRTLEHHAYPLASHNVRLVLCESGVRHELVQSQYKARRQQCEQARDWLNRQYQRQAAYLCEFDWDEWCQHRDALDEETRRRADHVLLENIRVHQGRQALTGQEIAQLGELMFQSHASSRDLFENSCPELDSLVSFAQVIEGGIGAKLTGGGFGGAAVNLVDESKVAAFIDEIRRLFQERYGHPCQVLACGIGEGAGPIELDI